MNAVMTHSDTNAIEALEMLIRNLAIKNIQSILDILSNTSGTSDVKLSKCAVELFGSEDVADLSTNIQA
eukprot:13829842-Heterocapsa_arctica.AAC.1